MARRRAANDPGVRVELTERQEEVLRLIAAGKTNGEIASALGVTLDGAKWHVREILARLGVASREEAVEQWRARGRQGRRRWGWLGWLLAAATGCVGAVTAVVLAVAPFGGGEEPLASSDAPAAVAPTAELPRVVFLQQQPPLSFAQDGEGWRLSMDRANPVPRAQDAVLAVRWDGTSTEVALVEAATGRVAARWETGYRPTAVFRPAHNEVLILHEPRTGSGENGAPVLLRFSLDDLEAPPDAFPLPGRQNMTVGIAPLALSADERWLFYIADGYPDCVDESQGFRDLRGCANERVGVIDLDDAERPPVRYEIGNACGRFEQDPGNPAGVLLRCDNTQHSQAIPPSFFAVDVNGASELSDPPGFLSFGAGPSGLSLMPDGRLFGVRISDMYTDQQGLMLSVYSPPFEPPVNTDDTRRWAFPGLASAVPLDEPGKALGVMFDGRVALIDLDTGGTEVLRYGLAPDTGATSLDEVMLAR